MSETELNDTQPNLGTAEPSKHLKKKFPGWLVILILVLLIAIGILSGYLSGMSKRYAAENKQLTGQLQEQYQLGLQAVIARQYEVAKQHFEFILQHNPDFPGAKAAYADLLLRMMTTPTPSPTFTPTITPTPDSRSASEIYKNVVALFSTPGKELCGRNWDDIISNLDALRKADITYHSTEVDGMYFISLRSRGVCKIYPQQFEPNASCQDLHVNLEGGIFDLTLAERFGPLDSDASALRTWARMYITGASFWDQDWSQVKNYFSQVQANMPQLADSTCTTATERLRLAAISYAQQLMNKGDYCGAEGQFREAFSYNSPKNEPLYPTATEVQLVCNGDAKAPKTPTP